MKKLIGPVTLTMMAFATGLVLGQNPGLKDGQPSKEAKGKVGLTVNDPRAFNGYTMFSPGKQKKTFLIDMQGRAVKIWDCNSEGGVVYLLPSGNLLRTGRISEKLTF